MAQGASSLPFFLSQHFSWWEGVIKQPNRRPWKCADALERDGAAQVQPLILNCNIPWFSNILIQHALLTIISRTPENNIWGELSQWSRQVVSFQSHKGGLCRSVQKLWIKKEGRGGGKLTHAFWPLAQNPGKIVKPDRQPVACSLCWLDCWFSQLCFVFLNQDLFGKFARINSQVLF